jgi:hypothetical protein
VEQHERKRPLPWAAPVLASPHLFPSWPNLEPGIRIAPLEQHSPHPDLLCIRYAPGFPLQILPRNDIRARILAEPIPPLLLPSMRDERRARNPLDSADATPTAAPALHAHPLGMTRLWQIARPKSPPRPFHSEGGAQRRLKNPHDVAHGISATASAARPITMGN